MLLRLDRERGRLRARLPVFLRRVDRARAIIAETLSFERSAPLFVSYSAGKDSAVMLDLVREQAPDIEARIALWPESEVIGNFTEVISAMRARGANVVACHMDRQSIDESVPDKWHRLATHQPASGYFVGLRREESAHRRISLARFGPIHEIRSGLMSGYLRVAPIADWSLDDVAAWIVTHDTPVLDTYEALGLEERTATRIVVRAKDECMSQLAQTRPWALAQLRRVYPDDIV